MNRVMTIWMAGMLLAGGAARAAWDSNPSFEMPYSDGWFFFAPAGSLTIPTQPTNIVLHGEQALKIDSDVFGQYSLIDHPHSTPVTSATYTVSASYYLPELLTPAENLGIGIWWLRVVNANWAYSTINPGRNIGLGRPGTETVGAWQRMTLSSTAPADAEFMMIQLEVTGGGSVVYFDHVSVSADVPIALDSNGSNLVIDFPGGGVLQSTTNLLSSPWDDVDGGTVTQGPYLVPAGQSDRSYRLRKP